MFSTQSDGQNERNVLTDDGCDFADSDGLADDPLSP